MKTFTAQLKDIFGDWELKLTAIVRASLQEVMRGAQADCPVDTGFLKNSLVSEVNGSFVSSGATGYALAIADVTFDVTARFGWTAEYAIYQELGWGGFAGRHFAGRNAARWPQIVEANARLVA